MDTEREEGRKRRQRGRKEMKSVDIIRALGPWGEMLGLREPEEGRRGGKWGNVAKGKLKGRWKLYGRLEGLVGRKGER